MKKILAFALALAMIVTSLWQIALMISRLPAS
mgnify:CR=1 FL=1